MENPFDPHPKLVGRATHQIHHPGLPGLPKTPFDSVALVLRADWRATQTDPSSCSNKV